MTFWVDDWITLSVVIPNDGNGKYFKVMLEKEAFIAGYDPVEGFVSPLSTPSKSSSSRELGVVR